MKYFITYQHQREIFATKAMLKLPRLLWHGPSSAPLQHVGTIIARNLLHKAFSAEQTVAHRR